jgi:hypothetical protein
MKWVEPKNGSTVFIVGSLIRAGSCVVFCVNYVWSHMCLAETWNLLWILSFLCCCPIVSVFGHVHCFRMSNLFYFASHLFPFVVEFVLGFSGQLLFLIESLSNPFCFHFSCALKTCVICNVQPNWRYVWWSIQCQMPKSPILRKDLSLDIKVNCWYSMIVNLFNPFCYHFLCALKTYVICKVQVICLFNRIEGFCHGLFNVKCPKAQFWGNRLL